MKKALFPAIAILTGLSGAFVGISFPLSDAQSRRGSDSLRGERPPSSLRAEESRAATEVVRVPARSAGESVLEHELRSMAWIRALARWDPENAFATALAHHEETGDSTLLHGVVAAMGASNPRHAIELIGSLNDELQAALVPGLTNVVLEENPDAAIQLFEAGVIELCERDTIGRAFDSFASAHPEEAATWILENREISSEIENVLKPFLEVSGGLETAVTIFGTEFSAYADISQDDLLLGVNLKTKFSDPSEAMAFADTISNPRARDIYRAAIARDLLNVDVDQAVDFFANALSPSFTEESAPNFLKHLATVDLDKALESVSGLVPADMSELLKTELYGLSTLWGLSLSDAQADDFIDSINSNATTQDFVSYQIMALVSEITTGTRGREWVDKIKEDANNVKLVALGNMAWKFVDMDPKLASEVIAEYPPQPERDTLVMKLIDYIPHDPERAIQWASYISEPESRANALNQIAETLQDNDPEEIQGWLSASPLTPDEQAMVREAVVDSSAP